MAKRKGEFLDENVRRRLLERLERDGANAVARELQLSEGTVRAAAGGCSVHRATRLVIELGLGVRSAA